MSMSDPVGRSNPVRLVVLVGNPRRGSRTRQAAEAVGAALRSHLAVLEPVDIVDLAEIATNLVEDGSPTLVNAQRNVANADVLVVATPVYKASYTGLLKLFLDGLPAGALAGTVAVPVTLAASSSHRALADLTLRPVLRELGASVPTSSLTLEESELSSLDALMSQWLERQGAVVGAVVNAIHRQSAVLA